MVILICFGCSIYIQWRAAGYLLNVNEEERKSHGYFFEQDFRRVGRVHEILQTPHFFQTKIHQVFR